MSPPRKSLPGRLFVAGVVLWAVWPHPAAANQEIDIVCPCHVETSNMTSVDVTFGVRNLRTDSDTGPLAAKIAFKGIDSDYSYWLTSSTEVYLPTVPANSTRSVQKYTVSFRTPWREGTYLLSLRLFPASASRLIESVAWLSVPVEIGAGAKAYSSIYFDGDPTLAIDGTNARVTLPAIRNPTGGKPANGLKLALLAHSSAAVTGGVTQVAERSLNSDLAPGKHVNARTVVVPYEEFPDLEYLSVQIVDGDGRLLLRQVVAVPEGEDLPSREFSTGDADMLLDSDGDGVGDVNERLMETDPDDASSTPPDSTVDVLAFYSQSVPDLYDGDATTRIRHLFTLAREIYQDSDTGVELRLVGMQQVEIDESSEYSHVDRELSEELAKQHGADVILLIQPRVSDSGICGNAALGGWSANGIVSFSYVPTARVFANCGAGTLAHEIGHVMGLGHSYLQKDNLPTGTFRWARGHGIERSFITVMAYGRAYAGAPRRDVFSDPESDCNGSPCGVPIARVDGAHSVAALNATRFQVARIGEWKPDTDGDGFVDPVDALPNDPDDHLDHDGDGIGNKADDDDDGDGVADAADLFPLDSRDWDDSDADGVGNNADAFPNDPAEWVDTDGDGVGDNGDLFPNDPTETVDTDHDGVGNNTDAFPFDTREWIDTDGDGIGDNADQDDDNDGVLNSHDVFPLDAARSDASSYRLILPDGASDKLSLSTAGDVDGDDRDDFLIGAVNYDFAERRWSSAAYLIAAADLVAADAADGSADRVVDVERLVSQPASWKFVSQRGGDKVGYSVALAGDISGDGLPELLIGVSDETGPGFAWRAGAAYLVSPADLSAADAADETTDGVVDLANIAAQANSWKFVGEVAHELAGTSVGSLGDMNGDNVPDFAIGAPGPSFVDNPAHGAAYLVSGGDLAATDSADGEDDGVIDLGQVASQSGSWKLTGEQAGDYVGRLAVNAYLDEEGIGRLIVHAPSPNQSSERTTGAAHLIAVSELEGADSADGLADGVVNIGNAVLQPESWQLFGRDGNRLQQAEAIGDLDGDGIVDLAARDSNSLFFLSGTDLAAADESDGSRDRSIHLYEMDAPGSWYGYVSYIRSDRDALAAGRIDEDGLDGLFVFGRDGAYLLSGRTLAVNERTGQLQLDQLIGADGSVRMHAYPAYLSGIAVAGDMDRDGREDLLVGGDGWVSVIMATDLGALDSADASDNGIFDLGQATGDTDQDGLDNIKDPDDDNDGVADFEDRFPGDALEWADRDRDRVGDNSDAFPDDGREQFDTDGDGIGDRADTDDDGDGLADDTDDHPLDTDNDGEDNRDDSDDDNDGVADPDDAFPLNSAESADFDADGVGDNADADDDNDGVLDIDDDLPFNAAESVDTDGDGTGDNSDAFPADPDETLDTDGDGQGNNADTDDDNDGTPDTADAFPFDATESADSDSDGIGDNKDAFPNDSAEWADTDADGIGNNADTDDDNDGYSDGADYHPHDPDRDRLFIFRLSGESKRAWTGRAVAAAGDVDSDGLAEVLIAAPTVPNPVVGRDLTTDTRGTIYVVSGSSMEAADLSDGVRDGLVEIGQIATYSSSWAIKGQTVDGHLGISLSAAGDIGGDGKPEWLFGASGRNSSTAAAYVISSDDLLQAQPVGNQEELADIHGILSSPGSWELRGEGLGDDVLATAAVAVAGDTDGDGEPELLIGTPSYRETDDPDAGYPGAAYLVSSAHLTSSNAAATSGGYRIDLADLRDNSGAWRFLGDADEDRAGASVSPAGDIDGDGLADFMIGAYGHSAARNNQGAIYLVASSDLQMADEADGTSDRSIDLENVHAQSNSWKLLGESWEHLAGHALTLGDTNADGIEELIIASAGMQDGTGAVYVLPLNALADADSADGSSDSVISLGNVAALDDAWKLVGEGDDRTYSSARGYPWAASVIASDIDADGRSDLLIGAPRYQGQFDWCDPTEYGAVYVVAGADFSAADSADGTTDGEISLGNISAQNGSWKLTGLGTERLGSSVAAAGDLDGDGVTDLVFGSAGEFSIGSDCRREEEAGVATVVSGGELDLADREDGVQDGVIDISAVDSWYRAVDFDFDGIDNAVDPDDDNDGYADTADAFPKNPEEWADSDHDGIGNNADPDDDNDGVFDAVDPFPFDPYETVDSDGDGIGDNADTDDDNDGVADADDAFPLDPSEWVDEDGDGIGDNADTFIDNPNADTDGDGITNGTDPDDDNDGVLDVDDLFPRNANKSDLFFYRLRGETRAFAGSDFDGDGKDDLIVKSVSNQNQVYLVSATDIGNVDDDDGDSDRVVDFDEATSLANSWKFSGVSGANFLAAAGDVDFDGKDDVVVAGSQDTFVIPMASMQAADGADNQSDRSITVSRGLESSTVGAWRLTAAELERGVYSLGDTNADSHKELLIGAPMVAGSLIPPVDSFGSGFISIDIPQSGSSTAYVASGSDWAAADALDDSSDGVIDLDQWIARANTFKLTSQSGAGSGASIASAGDFDGDGYEDLMVSVPGTSVGGALRSQTVYLLSGMKLNTYDAADGNSDGTISLNRAHGDGFWQLTGANFDPERVLSTARDVDGDGMSDMIIAANDGVFLIAAADMAGADAADGTSDRIIQVANAVTQPGSFKFATGESASSVFWVTGVGDVDSDSKDDILLLRGGSDKAHLITAKDFEALTAIDGVVNVTDITSLPNSWVLAFEQSDMLFSGAGFSGDLDGDHGPELVVGVRAANDASTVSAYVVSAAEFAVADTLDGAQDRSIALDTVSERWISD